MKELNNIFDLDLIQFKDTKEPEFYIGIDANNERNMAYCLIMVASGKSEVLLSKSISKKKKFITEVKNLSKYFDATICKEGDCYD